MPEILVYETRILKGSKLLILVDLLPRLRFRRDNFLFMKILIPYHMKLTWDVFLDAAVFGWLNMHLLIRVVICWMNMVCNNCDAALLM